VFKEEADKTAEFLLSKPISRSEIMISKLSVFLVYIMLLNIVVVITGFSCLEAFKNEDYNREAFFIISLYESLLMVFIGTLGLLISVFIQKSKSLSGISIIIVVAAYFIDSLSKITPDIRWIGYISPFRFVNTDVFTAEYGLDWWRIAYFVGLSTVCIVVALHRYKRKDILL
jgi:ABC-2 type transport system permease protein